MSDGTHLFCGTTFPFALANCPRLRKSSRVSSFFSARNSHIVYRVLAKAKPCRILACFYLVTVMCCLDPSTRILIPQTSLARCAQSEPMTPASTAAPTTASSMSVPASGHVAGPGDGGKQQGGLSGQWSDAEMRQLAIDQGA